MKTTFEVNKSKNNLDFTVKVHRQNRAPQLFNNLPVINCLERCGCTKQEIEEATKVIA